MKYEVLFGGKMYCIYREYGSFRMDGGYMVVEDFDTETLAVLSDEEIFQIENIEEILRPYKEKYEYRDNENGEYSKVWIHSCDN